MREGRVSMLFLGVDAEGVGRGFWMRERMDASPRPSTKLDILVIRLTETRLLQNCGERNWRYGNSTMAVEWSRTIPRARLVRSMGVAERSQPNNGREGDVLRVYRDLGDIVTEKPKSRFTAVWVTSLGDTQVDRLPGDPCRRRDGLWIILAGLPILQ